ncbi:MAG TPA: hypothetical protein VKE96_31225, partial [Vicinamibacterales bacterium]|nr:hypothetical protein [Vicinamibacterales bacterium]
MLQLRDPHQLRLEIAASALKLRVECLTGRVKLTPKIVDDLPAFVQQLDYRLELGARDVQRAGLADSADFPDAPHAQDSFGHGVMEEVATILR